MTQRTPDLSGEKLISIDIETYDPDLKTKGPSVYRGGGEIVGFSLGTPSGFSEYYNVTHPGGGGIAQDKALAYLRAVCLLPIPKVGANLLYDIDWLQNGYNVPIRGMYIDVQIAEALIDENQGHYSLEFLAEKYGVGRKMIDKPLEWARAHGIKDKDVRSNLHKMPFDVVYEYGKADATLPLEIYRKQLEIMEAWELTEIFDTECRLLPVLLKMRKQGVRIDRPLVDKLIDEAVDEIPKRLNKVYKIAGRELNPNSFKQMREWFQEAGVDVPKKQLSKNGVVTEKESFGAPILEGLSHPLARAVLDVRELVKMHGTFLTRNIRDMICPDGRIHGLFHPAKTDSNGTVTGRLSGSLPNLQQLPNAESSDYFAQSIRKVYIPEEGHLWGKLDYSQIEVRVLAHYARGEGSDRIREDFTANPRQDYHTWTAAVIEGLTVEAFLARGDAFCKPRRKAAKSINFGIMYGMGLKKLMLQLGVSEEEGSRIITSYKQALPFVMDTSNGVKRAAEKAGAIRTIGGRIRHFPDPAFAYKALNSLIQGSAADIMKRALVAADEAGLFDVLPVHLTVHDEIDVSIPPTPMGREAFDELKHVMEIASPLRVPTIADAETGPNWAEVS